MKYDDPNMQRYWESLPAAIQAKINDSGIDFSSIGMLSKFGDYYKNMDTAEAPEARE